LGNLEFFKKAKSAVYSTWHEYLVSFCGQCEEGIRTSSSAISNRRTVLIRLRKVRFVGATPAFLERNAALIIYPARIIFPTGRPIVHFDNATPHRAAGGEQWSLDSQFRHAPQPPSSPDVSPYDFLLFGDLKTQLRGEEFESMDVSQTRVEELVGQITSDQMRRLSAH
jgi:hypothetical protein